MRSILQPPGNYWVYVNRVLSVCAVPVQFFCAHELPGRFCCLRDLVSRESPSSIRSHSLP